jgi:hypothetical protein
MEAFASFFRSIGKKAQQKYYALIPEVLNILPPIKAAQESEELTRGLISLIDLAEVAPRMFKPLFQNLVAFSISVIQDKELTDGARQNALELMATFAEYAPALCKKDPTYTNDMITQCLSLMTDIGIDDDDAAEWNSSDDVSPSSQNADPDTNFFRWTLKRATSITLLVSNVWIGWPTNWEVQLFWPRRSVGSRE